MLPSDLTKNMISTFRLWRGRTRLLSVLEHNSPATLCIPLKLLPRLHWCPARTELTAQAPAKRTPRMLRQCIPRMHSQKRLSGQVRDAQFLMVEVTSNSWYELSDRAGRAAILTMRCPVKRSVGGGNDALDPLVGNREMFHSGCLR